VEGASQCGGLGWEWDGWGLAVKVGVDEGHLLTDSLDPFLLGESWDKVLKHDQPLIFSGN
jgi:hypothetical protein